MECLHNSGENLVSRSCILGLRGYTCCGIHSDKETFMEVTTIGCFYRVAPGGIWLISIRQSSALNIGYAEQIVSNTFFVRKDVARTR